MQNNYGTLRVGLIRTDISDREVDRDKLISDYLETENLDILVAPEYSFFLEKPAAEKEFEREVNGLADKTRRKKTLLLPGTLLWYDESDNMYNTLPVLEKGKMIFSYDKKQDGGDGLIATKSGKWYAGRAGRGIFEWRGLKLGVEICKDHGELKQDEETDLDLQFLVSAGTVLYEDFLVLKPGGYAILCDGERPMVEVRQQKDGGGTKRIEPSLVTDDGELGVYELTLPAAPVAREERYFWNSLF